MKLISFLTLFLFNFWANAQTVIPAKTLVPIQLPQDVNYKSNKPGSAVILKVEKDVVVNGVTVIAANSPVTGKVSMSSKTELKMDILEAKAVDGTSVRLSDCWIYTTIDQNPSEKYALFRKGTRKDCYTAVDVTIK